MSEIDREFEVPAETIAKEWVKAYSSVSAFVASLVRDVHDREDILQDTAHYLVTHASDYQGDGFARWAISVARYRVMEYRQRKVRVGLRQFSEANIDALAEAFLSLAPRRNDVREALEDCIEQLSDRARQVLELRYWDEAPVSRIATETRLTDNAVYVTLHRARTSLATCIEKRVALGGGR